MKKTLIALMALSNVTFGATLTHQEFDDALSAVITESGYTWGADSTVVNWTLQFTISGVDIKGQSSSATLATLNTGSYIVIQQEGGKDDSYLGVSSKATEIPSTNGSSWVLYDEKSADELTRTWIKDNLIEETFPVTWVSYDKDGSDADTDDDHVHMPLVGTTITLSSGYTGTSLVIDFTNGTKSIVQYTNGTMYNLNNFSLGDYVTNVEGATLQVNDKTYSIPSTPNIPEPTTATLSLLALAGLAARRRRK